VEQALIRAEIFAKIPGVLGVFGDAATSSDEAMTSALGTGWSLRPRKKQVHGISIVEVTSAQQECGEVDGVWTRLPGIALPVVTADCAPVLIAVRDGAWIAGIHAGWRGTVQNIIANFFESTGLFARDAVASIGPTIGPCCYEVSTEIIAKFQTEFPGVAIEPSPRRLDFKAALLHQFESAGMPRAQIEVSSLCTFCSPGFHSFRREKGPNRQHSAIIKLI